MAVPTATAKNHVALAATQDVESTTNLERDRNEVNIDENATDSVSLYSVNTALCTGSGKWPWSR